MKKMIAPSMMCVDFMEIGKCVRELERCGADYLHIDIMDGSFVPNYTLGTDFIRALKKNSTLPLDIHLMIERPEQKLDWFTFGEGDYVSIHAESTPHLQRALTAIRVRGAKPMVAINPATPVCAIKHVLDDVDAVLVMTVNPGYAGQKLVPATLEKIREVRKYLDQSGYAHVKIEVDGNVSFENASYMSKAGADIFVAGSSSAFAKGATLDQNMARLRESIE
ncbi:MAG: ribulose-phosphate 3-epimerase [Ruminococcaceae bacterium]|nr:ribulose-phosphate 3-epimerase [Oscillospiraceae bacterium]